MRLIDADELMVEISLIDLEERKRNGFNACVECIEQAPTIEPYENGLIKAYHGGYEDGYKNGKSVVSIPEIAKRDIETAYDKGLNDAWELVKRIESTPEDGGLTNEQIAEVFGQYWSSFELYNSFSAEEALDLYKRWEDKQKQDAEIKVGDEIVCNCAHAVVTYITPEGDWNGFSINEVDKGQGYTCMRINGWRKTGRHFPQITEVLAELRGKE